MMNMASISDTSRFWFPPIPDWKPLKKSKNSTLRIACITGQRLTNGLAFEGELLPLTPDNAKRVLRYAKADFVLIESAACSPTGHLNTAQHSSRPTGYNLIEILSEAKMLNIPSVYWLTEGNEQMECIDTFVKMFDLVCCADATVVGKLAKLGIEAEVLLPCVQPTLYNPFRHSEHKDAFSINFLYEYLSDLDQLHYNLEVIQKLLPLGLTAVETRQSRIGQQLNKPANLGGYTFGYMTPAARINALKYAKAYISHEVTSSTTTEQQWMSLEAAASGIPVVHCGSFGDGDIRREFAIECDGDMEFILELSRYRLDDRYRKRVAHLGWRKVMLQHTYAHRIREVSNLLGLRHDWVEYPKVSLITPTHRPELLSRSVATYEQIDYPNKELVLVINGDTTPSSEEFARDNIDKNIKIFHVPSDLFAGAALNAGHLMATGEYCFRIDDDDIYSKNYILDLILEARTIDAKFFGKQSAPLIFEGDECVYETNKRIPFTILQQAELNGGKHWIGGNSISGVKQFFLDNPYHDYVYGAADSALMLGLKDGSDITIMSGDCFNLAAERREDIESHTWKDQKAVLIAHRTKIKSLSDITI